MTTVTIEAESQTEARELAETLVENNAEIHLVPDQKFDDALRMETIGTTMRIDHNYNDFEAD